MEELEDIFKTDYYKSLSKWDKFKLRLKIAIYHLSTMY
jgi:hypothetical protein